jgi:hypothetical protein
MHLFEERRLSKDQVNLALGVGTRFQQPSTLQSSNPPLQSSTTPINKEKKEFCQINL